MEKSRRYQPAIRGIVGGVVLVAALAAFLGSSQSEAGIEQRATAFWEARIQGDDLTAYQYETYAHTGKMTATQYIQSRSLACLHTPAYTIEEIQEQENEASGQGRYANVNLHPRHSRHPLDDGYRRALGAS